MKDTNRLLLMILIEKSSKRLPQTQGFRLLDAITRWVSDLYQFVLTSGRMAQAVAFA